MANAYINLYKGNPTAGLVDGTLVSTDGANTAPFTFTIDASKGESEVQKAALRCEPGYLTTGNTTISAYDIDTTDDSDHTNYWGFAADNNYADANAANAAATFTPTLTIEDSIEVVNKVFWIKASSTTGEPPQNDRTVGLEVKTIVTAAVVEENYSS